MKTFIASLIFTCAAASAMAQYDLSGSVSGVFNNGQTSIAGLSYQGSTFDLDQITSYNLLFSGSPLPNNVDNFGSLNYTGSFSQCVGDTLTLTVSLNSPLTTGTNQWVDSFQLDSNGNFDQVGLHHALNYVDGPSIYGFTYGSIDFIAHPILLGANQPVAILGYEQTSPGIVSTAATPEPAPILVMGTLGAGLFLRRRRAVVKSSAF